MTEKERKARKQERKKKRGKYWNKMAARMTNRITICEEKQLEPVNSFAGRIKKISEKENVVTFI